MNKQLLAKKIAALPPEKRQLLVGKMVAQGIPLKTLPLVADPSANSAPLSTAQQRLWVFDQLNPGVAAYNMGWLVRLQGTLDPAALRQALDVLVARHSVLRSTFALQGDGSVKQLIQQHVAVPLDYRDVAALRQQYGDDGVYSAEIQPILQAFQQQPFDLQTGPLLRVQMLRESETSHIFQLVIHHIITDASSMQLMLQDLLQQYAGGPVPAPRLQYADFARWERMLIDNGAIDDDLAYWRKQLAGIPTHLDLPIDYPRPIAQSTVGRALQFELTPTCVKQLRLLGQRHNSTLFTVLLSAFNILLARYSGETDIVIGSPSSGRSQAQTQQMLGFFVNNLVLRSDLSDKPTTAQLLARVQQTVVEARAHEAVPFSKLIEAVDPARDMRYSPLFQVMLSLQPTANQRLTQAGVVAEMLTIESQTTQFDILLRCAELNGGLSCRWEYCSDLFSEQTAQQMLRHLQTLLNSMIAEPDRPYDELPLTDQLDAERLNSWNDTAVGYPTDCSIIDLFSRQVERTPDAPALVFGKQTLTYRELDLRSNRLANYLVAVGVSAETHAAVCMERSLEMVIALYGILKAGGAYVPIDPSYPKERIDMMLEDAAPLVILTQAHLTDRLAGSDATLACLDSWQTVLGQFPDTPTAASITPTQAMYVIFTSGSTGRPKGVTNEHRALVNRLLWMQDTFQLGSDDTVLQKTPFSFDVSVWEFFWPLLVGARLVVLEPEAHKDPLALSEAIRKHAVTTLHFVPSMLQLFLTEESVADCHSLRRVICSGEALPIEAVRSFAGLNSAELHNLYGPTEAAIDVSWWHCDPSADSVPIGKPIANTQLHILDPHLKPVPIGVAGELHIGGIQVARGYLKRPQLTAERFIEIENPDGERSKLYRTGDLCRYLPDGNIAYLGRIDHQVKIRGLRIELGEIESVLTQLPAVREATVLAREDVPGQKKLVAYVVGVAAPLSLRNQLAETLPDYMIPSAFVVLDEMPLSPNGKVDRRALPAPRQSSLALSESYVAPRCQLERELQAVWKQFLKLSQISIHDNFFALGGDSLIAIWMAAHLKKELSQPVRVDQIFRGPTIAQLAALLDADSAELPSPINKPWQLPSFPLSPSQQWVKTFDPYCHHMNMAVMLDVAAELNPSVLQRAVKHWFDHFHMLRIRLLPDAERGWRQEIMPPGPAPLTVIDLSNFADPSEQITARAAAAQSGFDLLKGPLVRILYFDLGPSRSGRVLIIINHFVCDLVSFNQAVRHLMQNYVEASTGQAMSPPPPAVFFSDWINYCVDWADSAEIQAKLADWLKLRDAPFTNLPTDFSFNGADVDGDSRTIIDYLTSSETERLVRQGQSADSSIMALLAGAVLHALRNWINNPHQLVNVVTHGRQVHDPRMDVSNCFGWFGEMDPFWFDTTDCETVHDISRLVAQTYAHQAKHSVSHRLLTFMASNKAVREQMATLPTAQVELNYTGDLRTIVDTQELEASGLEVALSKESYGPTHDHNSTRRQVIKVMANIANNGAFRLMINYNPKIHSSETAQMLLATSLEALRAVVN